jgi:Ca-activated chloride channel family protein
VTVHYRLPRDSSQRMTAYRCPYSFTEFADLPPCYRFASSVALFAAMLKNSKYVRKSAWADVINIANESGNHTDVLQQEFIAMVEKAKKIYGRTRKRKN